jgi:hypothetical protein
MNVPWAHENIHFFSHDIARLDYQLQITTPLL